MTQEHITITEEVQKDGRLQQVERTTLQTTVETPEEIAARQAMSVNHPDYVAAEDRVYTYDEALGMSTSRPRDLPVEDDSVTHEPEEDEPSDEEVLKDEEDVVDDEPETEVALCLHPIGNGECQLPADHSGSHKMYVE